MKRSIHTLLAGLLIVAAFTVKAQSVSYTYVRNDPFDHRNFSASIDPFFLDINGHNGYAFGWGVRGEYMMGKALMFNFDSRFGFGTNLYRLSNDNTRNYFNMEGCVGFIFANKTHNRNLPIILSQTTSGNTRTTVSIRGGVPAKVRTIVAFRLGLIEYTNTLKYDNKGIADSLLTFSANGKTITYRDAKADKAGNHVFSDTTAKVNNTFKPVDQYGGIAMTTLHAGFNFRSIRNLVIDVDGYGIRSNVALTDFYIDVLFAPVMALKDFKNSDGTTYTVKYGETTSFGWRLGQFFRHPKEQGFSFKWEIGSRPGFKADKKASVPVNWRNTYFMMTFGLYIPLKIKPIYMGE